jgi:hypothetical protein
MKDQSQDSRESTPCGRCEREAIYRNSRQLNKVSWQPSITKVLPDEFGEVIAGPNVAVIYCYASWNRYDVTMDQMLCEIADAYTDHIFIGSIDTDENSERCKEFRISKSACNSSLRKWPVL